MTTDEEKSKLAKLLHGLEIPDIKLTERCSELVKDFHKKFSKDIEEEENGMVTEVYENPYKVDKSLLEETEKKLRELKLENKRGKKQQVENVIIQSAADPKRPWRTNTNKEKLLRINNELKHHHDRASQIIAPLDEGTMKNLVRGCQEESEAARPVAADRLRDTVEEAKKNLPNFQYRNSTAIAILPEAHESDISVPVLKNNVMCLDEN